MGFAVVIAVAVAKAHPGVHRSGGYSHSSSSHGSPHASSSHSSSYSSPHSSSSHSSSYGSTHSSSSYSSPHSSSSHTVHKGKRSAEPEPAPSYNFVTVYETVYEMTKVWKDSKWQHVPLPKKVAKKVCSQ